MEPLCQCVLITKCAGPKSGFPDTSGKSRGLGRENCHPGHKGIRFEFQNRASRRGRKGQGDQEHQNTDPSISRRSGKALTPLARCRRLSRAPLDPQQDTRFYGYQ